ncbi:PQQ-dependent sugar dehydrogenase [Aerophototrophica crusticola]|uniref:PQQ-dependent sugar dehydrogenase n=2 Tax=Aerophototrophica crusticola TaxID=1709002 RepID=A0A858RBM7_9PROT|nr:PQQ-dependent sugar dehydrogenase [Rhodospirillaceae bacterium B3]
MMTGALLTALALAMAPTPAVADEARTVPSQAGPLRVETVAGGLDHPWGIAFLPDGRMLVTERAGRLRVVSADGTVSGPLRGVPDVAARGQGGLLDVALDPAFDQNRQVYITYSEPGPNGTAGTAVARATLGEGALENLSVIFRQEPKVTGGNHYGSRLAFTPDGSLFVTLGERFKFDPAQDLSNHLGKVVRLRPDGTVPPDNPFVNRQGARPEIWSYGHRNPQGIAVDPRDGKVWTIEFGPQGGDELNRPDAGKNHGWPLVSWGEHYDGRDIPDPPTRPDFADAVRHWVPAISPSGMAFYRGTLIPGWQDNLLVASLGEGGIVRLTLEGDAVTGQESIPLDTRIRQVVTGPDGAVYALTDEEGGSVLRLSPATGDGVAAGGQDKRG